MGGEIRQAYFGERNGGHRLLSATVPDDPVVQRLAGTTDHLSAPDRGVEWAPYVSGYPLGGKYVLSRTFEGPVTTRAGWALTHALILEEDDAAGFADLGSLLDLLAVEPNPDDVAALPLPRASAPPSFGPPGGRVGAAVRQLIDRAPGSRPVVWIGQEGFEDLLARVWAGLWPAARRGFAFRTGFRPEDAERHDTSLFSTPLRQVGRWAGFPLVRPDASHEPLSPAELMLAGRPDSLRTLVGQLGLPGEDLRSLRHVEAVAADLRDLHTATPSQLRMLARRLGSVAPSPGSARGAKDETVRRLVQGVASAEPPFLFTLRNLDTTPFVGAAEGLGSAVAEWVELHLPESTDRVAEWLLCSAADALPWWRNAVHGGVRRRLSEPSPATARLVWDMWLAAPAAVPATAPALGAPGLPALLAEATPSVLDRSVAAAVMNGARHGGWPALFAAVAAAANPAGDAVDLLVEAFPGSADAGLEILGRRLPGADITRAVVARRDAHLDGWAGRLIAGAPALRTELDPEDERGRALWLASAEAGAPVWEGIEDPPRWRDAVLESLEEDGESASALAVYIAGTPTADLSGTRWESRIWNVLPAQARDGFLRSTAAGWVDRFRRDPHTVPLPAEPVRARVLADGSFLRARPTHTSSDLGAGLAGVERFRRSEQGLLQWIADNRSVLARLTRGDAERLGDLVARERWGSAAQALYSRRESAPSLYPALWRCASILPLLSQLRLSLERPGAPPPPPAFWYEALYEFLARELSRGPGEENVWKRAGGDLSQLSGSTPAEQWWSAVDLLRRGRGGRHITVRKLLEVLSDVLPRNSELITLRQTAPDA